MLRLEKGKFYTRHEVRMIVGGGSLQSYLPTNGGPVLAGVFTLKDNPLGPRKIFAGTGKIRERGARQVVKESHPLPVFMKGRNKKYEFVGHFRAASLDTSQVALDEANKLIGKDRTFAVISFEMVS